MTRLCRALIVLMFLGASPVSAAGPQLIVDQPTVDLGKILQGNRVEHVYSLRNNGDQVLVIQKVRSSCGCTAALLSASEIAPGQTGEVKATFNSGGFRGPVQKTITLYTNEPTRPNTVLRLEAQVMPLLEAEPAAVTLDPPVAGKRQKATVVLRNHSQEAIALTGVHGTNPLLQVQLAAQSIPAGGSVPLTVGSVDEPAGGSLSGYVLVRTASPGVPELRISVYGPAAPER